MSLGSMSVRPTFLTVFRGAEASTIMATCFLVSAASSFFSSFSLLDPPSVNTLRGYHIGTYRKDEREGKSCHQVWPYAQQGRASEVNGGSQLQQFLFWHEEFPLLPLIAALLFLLPRWLLETQSLREYSPHSEHSEPHLGHCCQRFSFLYCSVYCALILPYCYVCGVCVDEDADKQSRRW